MAGIKVPQYDIFKISTADLRYKRNKKDEAWNYTVTKEDARKRDQLVSLFEAQEFRLIAKILNKEITKVDFEKYILIVVIDNPQDFNRAVSKKGIKVNGITFKRFVGTSGGLKNNTIIFVNAEILDELSKRCNCDRNEIAIVPAKLETYKALTCSASQPICDPNGIIVVPDCITHIKEDVIMLDDSDPQSIEPKVTLEKNYDLENTNSDGFNLCTIGYMQRVSESLGLDYIASGVCLRNAWLKGMLYPFPIKEFIEKYNNGNHIITDIWGHRKDLLECEMILTESSLKLWKAYDSVEDYVNAYKKNGYTFAVTKIVSPYLEDQRELNYQYLQSYEFSDEDIEKLCKPTVDYLKAAGCGGYEETVKFLGITDHGNPNSWQQALYHDTRLLNDPYIIDSVHRMIRKKIDGAKIGKIRVDGNYQIVSGDPFALMQSICGLEITGLLKANEIYSDYWVEKKVADVLVFRSPMTSHNNIRRCSIPSNEKVRYWYQYMSAVMIFNAFDTICQAENGMDSDGDICYITNNDILLKLHKRLPAILCIQRNCDKIVPTEKDLVKTNKDAMGNKVGTITNRVTAMIEVQSHFQKESKEYQELQKRIECGQLYQQNEIDKLKGIVAKPMPSYWYSRHSCKADTENKKADKLEEDFLKSICVDKKPYFMTYVYDDYRARYNNYLKTYSDSAKSNFHKSIEQLLEQIEFTEDEKKFIDNFNRYSPFGRGDCAMNKICYHIEREFKDFVIQLKAEHKFDYRFMKYGHRCTSEHKAELMRLLVKYKDTMKYYREHHSMDQRLSTKIYDKDIEIKSRESIGRFFREDAARICPDEQERNDIILDLTYGLNNDFGFCWDCIGYIIVKHLKEMNNDNK